MCFGVFVDEGGGECAGESDPEYDHETTGLIFQGHPLADQLLARADQRTDGVRGSDFTCTGLKNPVRARRASLRSVLWVASDLSAW